jgi:hypothetical protein
MIGDDSENDDVICLPETKRASAIAAAGDVLRPAARSKPKR